MGNSQPVQPPKDVPMSKIDSLLIFDIREKKREIFEDIRNRVRTKAQFTKSGRMPWTQITVCLPIIKEEPTNEREDLAVVWSLMQNCTHGEVKINERNGDHIWTMHGHDYLCWILGDGVPPRRGDEAVIYSSNEAAAAAAEKRGPPPPEPEWKNWRPADKYIHPIMYETGSRKRTLLQTKIKKAKRSHHREDNNVEEVVARLEKELNNLPENNNDSSSTKMNMQPKLLCDDEYHWAGYEECIVTFKTKQSRKQKHKELQLTIKIRTYYLGVGDPKEHNGYLKSCKKLNDVESSLDPKSKLYKLMKQR